VKVLVTGGTGDVGRAAVTRLTGAGHFVRVVGRRQDLAVRGAEYRSCDILDYPGLRREAQGMDAIVHLAAVRAPSLAPPQELWHVNVTGTFNVYQAAVEHGIKRVVSASSINALGYFYGVARFDLAYLPVDERHPVEATDAYSFSKQVLEQTADYFWRRERISGTCLRLPWVYELNDERTASFKERYRWAAGWGERLLGLEGAARRSWLEGLRARIDRFRAARGMETGVAREDYLSDEEWLFYTGMHNLWTTVDARDSAQAIEKSLLAEYDGAHPLFINDAWNTVGLQSADLARLFYPEARPSPDLAGEASLVSIDGARRLIGFEPEHPMRAAAMTR
jgi:nucleoside-diphosphate-sugar epimerase